MSKHIKLHYPQDICQLYQHFKDEDYSVLLDSDLPKQTLGRFDILCARPCKQLHIWKNRIELTENNQSRILEDLAAVKEVLRSSAKQKQTGEVSAGAWLGFAEYELASSTDADPDDQLLFWAAYYPWAIIQDHQQQSCKIVWHDNCSDEQIQAIFELIQQDASIANFQLNTPFTAQADYPSYQRTFNHIQDDIQHNKYQQINFAQAFSAEYSGHPFAAYQLLREAVPSHYMAYINHPEKQILSISPECFLKAQGYNILSQPIKGTAPRGQTHKEDTQLAEQLKSSVKNQQENLLTVEAVIEELEQHCQENSVSGEVLLELQSFANVHHLVSSITGKLKDGVDIWDVFFSCFPGGSITGAPKQAAMDAIQHYETFKRGPYCGSIFYAGDDGYFNSSIAIRTLSCQNNTITTWAGGGITAMSDAADEYQECFNKIQAFIDVLEQNASRLPK